MEHEIDSNVQRGPIPWRKTKRPASYVAKRSRSAGIVVFIKEGEISTAATRTVCMCVFVLVRVFACACESTSYNAQNGVIRPVRRFGPP